MAKRRGKRKTVRCECDSVLVGLFGSSHFTCHCHCSPVRHLFSIQCNGKVETILPTYGNWPSHIVVARHCALSLSLPLYLIRHFLSFVRSLISLILEKNVYNVSSIYTSHWTYNMAYCDRTHKWLYPKYIFELTSAPYIYIYVYINGWTANGIERWRHPDTINWISWDGIRQPSRHYWRNKGFRSKLMDKCHQVLDHQVINQIKLKQKQNKKSCMYPCR